MANIANLKQALGAGGRVNKYRINFSIPSAVPVTSDLQNADVLCKAAQFPGVTITPIEVFNQGRKLVIPGDTVYENTWTLTFYNTADHALRRDLISWMRSADDFQKNTHSGNPNDVLGELSVTQLDSLGKETVTYTFHNVWVSGVEAVELTDDADGGIQEFAVTFSFSDWVVGGGEYSEPSEANQSSDNSIA
jgi:hypothetical protein